LRLHIEKIGINGTSLEYNYYWSSMFSVLSEMCLGAKKTLVRFAPHAPQITACNFGPFWSLEEPRIQQQLQGYSLQHRAPNLHSCPSPQPRKPVLVLDRHKDSTLCPPTNSNTYQQTPNSLAWHDGRVQTGVACMAEQPPAAEHYQGRTVWYRVGKPFFPLDRV
jgi:hypothetical protein